MSDLKASLSSHAVTQQEAPELSSLQQFPFLLGARSLALLLLGVVSGALLFGSQGQGLTRANAAAPVPDTTYEIKLRNDRVGDKVLVVKDDNALQKMTLKDPDGKVLQDTAEKSTENLKYVEETL